MLIRLSLLLELLAEKIGNALLALAIWASIVSGGLVRTMSQFPVLHTLEHTLLTKLACVQLLCREWLEGNK